MDKIGASVLLERIIKKGGIIGKCAEFYAIDEIKADEFIRECSQQIHNPGAIRHWGQELVSDISKYIKTIENKDAR